MDGRQIDLDLLTQQFIVHRWHTSMGREIREQIADQLKLGEPIDEILDKYVLKHPANVESYDYPYYPPDAMMSQDFWVLANDDLRGIQFFEEDFSGTPAFAKVNLSYCTFSGCNLSDVNFELSDLSHSSISQCDLSKTVFDNSVAIKTKMTECNLRNAVLLNSSFRFVDFSSSDLRGVYFENTKLRGLKVNYLTKLDRKLATKWGDRKIPTVQLPDLYRSIRLAYERAEMPTHTDYYLLRENVMKRRYLYFPELLKRPSWRNFYVWSLDYIWALISGYGTKPVRTLVTGFFISMFYCMIYFIFGGPEASMAGHTAFLSIVYFSFTTYATLGYGDITYTYNRPYMRLVSTSEAWLGAIMIALFVVVIARKIIRRR